MALVAFVKVEVLILLPGGQQQRSAEQEAKRQRERLWEDAQTLPQDDDERSCGDQVDERQRAQRPGSPGAIRNHILRTDSDRRRLQQPGRARRQLARLESL